MGISCFCCERRCDVVCNGFCEWPFRVAASIAHPIPLPVKEAPWLFCYLGLSLHLLRKESFPFKCSGEMQVSAKCYEVLALHECSASFGLFYTFQCTLSGKTSEETCEWLCKAMLRNSPAREYQCSTPFWNAYLNIWCYICIGITTETHVSGEPSNYNAV